MSFLHTRLLCFWLLLTAFSPALAEELDPQIKSALEQVQALLKNPGQRGEAAKANPGGVEAERFAHSVGGNEQNTQAIFELAAEILGNLVAETGGDPDKMQKLLDAGKLDPKTFAEKLTPAQKEKLKALSLKVPASLGSGTPPP